MPLSKGRRTNYNNHVLHSGDKGVQDNYKKYDTVRLSKASAGRSFNIVGTHLYRGVTAQEIDLRESYIKSLISNFENVDIRRVTTKRVDYSYDLARRTETYHVIISSHGWGKVIVNVIGANNKDLQFIMFKRADKGGKYHTTKKKSGRWNK